MAKKYIDANELNEKFDTIRNPDSEFASDDYIDGFADGVSAAMSEVDKMPAADVMPVKHGHWIENFGAWFRLYECSKCHECINQEQHYDYTNNIMHYPKYCEHCGAEMIGDESGKTPDENPALTCDSCEAEIPKAKGYIYLDSFEKTFCCTDCLIDWLLANQIAEWDINGD